MMLTVKTFTFNIYQENTFVISTAGGECAIIDPGCYEAHEKESLAAYIEEEKLTVKYLLNTHGHIDHMLGNDWVVNYYGVPFLTHEIVIAELDSVPSYAQMFGLNPDPSPRPDKTIDEGDIIELGDIQLKVLFTPGHSPGHISFYYKEGKQLFSGDVLFDGSIGRVDLPGGSMEVLMDSITKKLLPLGDEVQVYCGHGQQTTIGKEKDSNPFILDYLRRS